MKDRPLECSSCKKELTILYTKICDGEMQQYVMCENCPLIKEKIGESSEQAPFSEKENVCCVQCGCSLSDILTTVTVGCSSCYQIFHDSIHNLFVNSELLPIVKRQSLISDIIHIGRKPEEELETSISSRIVELNNALSLAIRDENYEHAASLRDEINNLINKNE